MSLVDMKSDKDESENTGDAAVAGYNKPDYPYGLCLNLGQEQLDKLGIKTLPAIGGEFHIKAVGEVTGGSKEAGEDGEASISIQITMLELIPEEPHPGEGNETPADEERERVVTKRGVKTVIGGY